MMHFYHQALVLLCLCHTASSFLQSGFRKATTCRNNSSQRQQTLLSVTGSTGASDEERATALSNYLAKAHIEKLKAIQEVETKSRAEIDELKQEIQKLKGSSSPSSSSAIVAKYSQLDPVRTKVLQELSKEELMARILQYQDQMQAYMVKSLQERTKAVEAAKASAQQQLAESLKLLAPGETNLYAARNTAIGRAGEKSRWGAQEVAKVTGSTTPPDPVVPKKKILPSSRAVMGGGAAPSPQIQQDVASVDSEVIQAADHGLRADGGVSGPSLAERLAQGSNLGGGSSATTTPPLYTKRNAKIQAAAAKSRWGSQEINRLAKPVGNAPAAGLMFTAKPGFLPSSVATFNGAAAPPAFPSAKDVSLETIEAADHGLRADGGVGGMTLLERVTKGANVGAQIVQRAAAKPAVDSDLYSKRNAKVSAAEEKSRWGTQEIQKINSPSNTGSSTGAASATALPGSSSGLTQQPASSVIQAADHGLRADGGVGGPSLADRVATASANFGAQLVAAASRPSSSSRSAMYDLRNAKVLKAQRTSRWGGAEVQKLASASPVGSILGSPVTTALPGSPVVPHSVDPKAIEAADHGLRADGGVGGPSLADRVHSASANVGGSLAAASASSSVLYERRNVKVKSAAAVGKSRWGGQEVERIQKVTTLPPPAATAKNELEQRVNFGANLVMR